MIESYFMDDGRPYVEGHLYLPRFELGGWVHFLIDTGAGTTILHQDDGIDLRCPFDALENPAEFVGVGGTLLYYMEPAVLTFGEGFDAEEFDLQISIAKPPIPLRTSSIPCWDGTSSTAWRWSTISAIAAWQWRGNDHAGGK